jgi:hypothetical protein
MRSSSHCFPARAFLPFPAALKRGGEEACGFGTMLLRSVRERKTNSIEQRSANAAGRPTAGASAVSTIGDGVVNRVSDVFVTGPRQAWW